MTVLDWIIVAIISIGAILGFTKGFIRQLASIVGLVVGLLVARALFASVGEKLAEELGTSLTFAQVVAFILIWLLVPLVFLLLASALTRVIEIVHLGFVNRILGAALGKKLKKGPEEYSDVREEVEIDYRREQERGLLTSLMQHFGVEIEQDVLKTVNCCGSN